MITPLLITLRQTDYRDDSHQPQADWLTFVGPRHVGEQLAYAMELRDAGLLSRWEYETKMRSLLKV